MCNSFYTVQGDLPFELVERKSKFISYIKSVLTEQEALDFINEKKSEHWSAKHNVYAYILKENNIFRYSDDGEPHGTAGLPVLEVLKKHNLMNVVTVVTRYFGGILLGTGGLVRAYSQAVLGALKSNKIVEMTLCCRCEVCCDYNQYGKLMSIINGCFGVLDNVNFSRKIRLNFHVKKDNLSSLINKFNELSSGNLNCNILEESFCQI